mmetsp:Transcript_16582/g.39691  ORF Transcript_16582/g.39691 Transcript_16582/m.39691 type:complete len:211 (-) Transcript_16582:99-731(-)
MLFTAETFHMLKFQFTEDSQNIPYMLFTAETSHLEMSPVNEDCQNIAPMLVTDETFQPLMFPLNEDERNKSFMSVMRLVSAFENTSQASFGAEEVPVGLKARQLSLRSNSACLFGTGSACTQSTNEASSSGSHSHDDMRHDDMRRANIAEVAAKRRTGCPARLLETNEPFVLQSTTLSCGARSTNLLRARSPTYRLPCTLGVTCAKKDEK